jgi:hypothetical protein
MVKRHRYTITLAVSRRQAIELEEAQVFVPVYLEA